MIERAKREGSLAQEPQAVRILSPRAADAFGLLMLALGLIGAALLAVGSRPLIVPYWYALVPLHPGLLALLPGVLGLIVYALVGYTLRDGPPALAILWAVLGGIVLPVAFLAAQGNPLEQLLMRTISSQATGGFSKGVEFTAETARRWPELMADWRTEFPHVAISLPGWPLVYGGLVSLFERVPSLAHLLAAPLREWQCHQWGFNTLRDAQVATAWLGVASPLWSALTVLPLYALARRVAGRSIALLAALLWPLVPATILFMGTLNSPYPLLATTIALALWTGITGAGRIRGALLVAVAGALSGAAIVLNLALVPVLLLCGLLALFAPWTLPGLTLRSRFMRSILAGVWFAVGLLVVGGLYALYAGHSPLRVIAIALGVHFGMARAYLTGVGLHLWDFVLFTGGPLCALACLAGYAAARRRTASPVAALAGAFGLTLLILLLSGAAQGEVGRVWLFFMPLVVLLAAVALRGLTGRGASLTLLAQSIWLVALVATTGAVDTWLGARPAYAGVTLPSLAAPLAPTDARFGDALRLTGFQSEADADGKTLRVAFHWDVERRMSAPYYFSAVLVAPDGRVLPAVNWQPFAKAYPTTCWAPGEGSIVDQVTLPLGDAAAKGDWWLSLTVFSLEGSETPQLLPVILPDGKQDQQFGVGPLPVR